MIEPGSPEATLANEVRAAVREIALPRFRRLGQVEVRLKSAALDPVTEVDERLEARLADVCRGLWPEAAILGEEAAAADPNLERVAAEAEMAVVIDPLDGTWNYTVGTPVFGTIVAVVRSGRPVFALIHDAMGDRCLAAAAGSGVWERSGGGAWRSMHPPAPPTSLPAMSACLPAQPTRPLPRVGRVMASGASCHDYRLLAQGDLHLNLAGTPRAWDHLAGSLIIEEIGGRSAWIDGRDYRLGGDGEFLLSALTPEVWEEFAKAFARCGSAPSNTQEA